jgi:hypothetical protein
MNNSAIEIDKQQGIYKMIILIHFFVVSVSALFIDFIVLYIILRKIHRGTTIDMKLSAIVIVLDIGAAIGTFIRAIICQDPYNLLVYSSDWCKFDVLFTTQLLLFSGVSIGVLSVERLLLVCYNKKIAVWIWITVILAMCSVQYCLFAINVFKDRQKMVNIAVYCTVGVSDGAEAMRLIFLFNLISSYVMVIFSYLSIMIFRYKQSFDQLNMNIPKDQVIRECLNTIWKSLINVLLFILVYFFKVYSLCYEIATGNMRTWLMDYMATIFISCSLILNTSVLLYMNNDIRKDLIKLFTTLDINS